MTFEGQNSRGPKELSFLEFLAHNGRRQSESNGAANAVEAAVNSGE